MNDQTTPPPETAQRIRSDYAQMERTPGVLSAAETLLRHPGQILFELKEGRRAATTRALLVVSVICLLAYGFTVGMFSWGHQLWVAPVKITLGLLASAAICLPSLVIFSCLAGSATSISEITRLLVALVALTSLLLLGFGPVSWIFSQSTDSAGFMGFLQLAFWGIGTYYGLRFLFDATRFLNGERGQHLAVWSIIFILVCLQMTTTLRPIIGTSDHFLQGEKKFFLAQWGECIAPE